MDFHFPSWTWWTVHVYGAVYLMAIEQLACFLKTHPRSVFVGQALFFFFWKCSTKIDQLNSQLWGNAWPRSRRRARSRYARGSLHHSQAAASAMRFIYGPNKPEQNILCGRLQSVLLWLEMKLKNVSEASQRSTFVTFFFPQESNIAAQVFLFKDSVMDLILRRHADGSSCREQVGTKQPFAN